MCRARFSDMKALIAARDAGWKIGVKDGSVVFEPPATVGEAKVEAERQRIAEAVGRIAERAYGWCYSGCKD